MKNKNFDFEKIGKINAAILFIVIFFKFVKFANITLGSDDYIEIAALAFGIYYSIAGYKKDSAKYYKIYLCLFALSCIVSIINTILSINGKMNITSIIFIIALVVMTIGSIALAFVSNLGRNKSLAIAYTILACSFVMFIQPLLTGNFAIVLKTSLSYLALAYITYFFVIAKYKDKENRGSN